MGTIGDTLREARMRQQIDIAELEDRTKIRAKYLRALENEEFSLLPDATRARSFLRTYADALGLDSRLLVEEYRAQYEVQDETPELQPVTATPRRRREGRPLGGPERRPPGRGALIAAAVVALLAFLAILGITGEDEPGDGGGSNQARTQTSDEQQRAERERAERREREREKERARAEEAKRRVKLGVFPAGAEGTYACVDDGEGEILFEGVITEPQTFRGKRVRINLGRRQTELRLNNEKVEIEQAATPVALEFKSGEEPKEIVDEPSPCA